MKILVYGEEDWRLTINGLRHEKESAENINELGWTQISISIYEWIK